ncbi:hypothetical protein PABG_11710 [Paracoccidioides brasiliensis Pb03]|uniref:Uncharacterized protein n=1 Tax=Paracoccidioides brasiliensis (strain Pb18) TaxID=502780 RepID=A0A0A0HVR7_PARBD|nr:uncharacterized protein PADG_11310 [Paracoccidioides brasiliensis Pb18]KGM92488.1 hypothetical protein PADG_11310 [Paracoccidioides brasiliensis Pb18]KGY15404.1 hypothetical protein PABG_11710 [Paracoccidioides brasiliensis Pb03]
MHESIQSEENTKAIVEELEQDHSVVVGLLGVDGGWLMEIQELAAANLSKTNVVVATLIEEPRRRRLSVLVMNTGCWLQTLPRCVNLLSFEYNIFIFPPELFQRHRLGLNGSILVEDC